MVKRHMRVAALSAVFAVARLCIAADLSGNWIASIATPGEPQYARVSIKLDGEKLSGTWDKSRINGTVKGDELAITLTDDQGTAGGSLEGKLSGDTLTGTAVNLRTSGRAGMAFGGGMGGRPVASGPRGGFGGGGALNFTMTRAVALPAGPRDIHFDPTNFFATYSGANKPALTIFPGDVVHTWTADAGGVDAKGVRHRGGDSNIGPFYVEGALPGDTLVLHLLKVRTNRSTAHQGTRINPHAVTAAYLLGAQYDPAVTGDWRLLPEKA